MDMREMAINRFDYVGERVMMMHPTLRVFWAPPRFVADLQGAQADVVGQQ